MGFEDSSEARLYTRQAPCDQHIDGEDRRFEVATEAHGAGSGVIQSDGMPAFPSPAPNPELGHSVLPRTAHARANGLKTAGLEKPEYIAAELRVTVEHDVPVATGKAAEPPAVAGPPNRWSDAPWH
jgi:hypothetical protein